jgi:hypothetical protein
MTTKRTWTLGTHDNRPALFNDRGLVATFEAGYQQTRELDSIEVFAALKERPLLLAQRDEQAEALLAVLAKSDRLARKLDAVGHSGEITIEYNDVSDIARAALAKVRL